MSDEIETNKVTDTEQIKRVSVGQIVLQFPVVDNAMAFSLRHEIQQVLEKFPEVMMTFTVSDGRRQPQTPFMRTR